MEQTYAYVYQYISTCIIQTADAILITVLHYGMQMMMAVASIAWSSLTACLANTAHSTFRVPRVIRKVSLSRING